MGTCVCVNGACVYGVCVKLHTAFILSISLTAPITCHSPVFNSSLVVYFPSPEEVPVMTQIFLSPNFWSC
ncbi:hypothetical protein EON63_16595 [archaeon]|nr:MAG: hypothetical protein EON63_16595 [archaeon]